MNILERIVSDTREVVARRRGEVPVSGLEGMRYYGRVPGPFIVRGDELAVIAEVKKASPSKGVIREDFDAVDIAGRFEAAGATALSILTEPLYFQGALEYLEEIRERSMLPLLRKDFIIDEYQLHEARAYGADAVLLIAAVLDRYRLHDLLEASRALGLSALVEVYDLSELDRIDFDEVSLLGVNNRDLRTFEVDVNHSLRVFEHVPANVVRVSESGLSSAVELVHLRSHGVDAVLIGETFMRQEDPGAALERMLEEVRSGVWS